MAKMVLPICGDLIDTDEIVGVLYLEPVKADRICRHEFLPRVRIDTRQQVATHIIECDSVETALKVRDAITAACVVLPPAPIAEPAMVT
jgi:hypothetical protein